MTTAWRQYGWQRFRFTAPADWYYTKIGMDPASGDLWLADERLPRLQMKWLDAAQQKHVDPAATLTRYLEQLERQAKKARTSFEAEREVRLVGKAGRDISSLEAYHFVGDVEAWGAIWYSPQRERVVLAQVNGPVGEDGLKALARRVLKTIRDEPSDDGLELWTAYDLECWAPADFRLAAQTMETGHTELRFEHRRDTLTVARYGLASIALGRYENLGDWAHGQRFRSWITFHLEREESRHGERPAVTFRGRKRSWAERLRSRTYNFFGRPYPIDLTALAWHCEEANCLMLIEHFRDARSADLAAAVAETVPCRRADLSPPL